MKTKRKGKLQIKFLIGLIAMEIILSVSLGLLVSTTYRNNMENYYSDIAFNAATLISNIIDGDKITEYVNDFKAGYDEDADDEAKEEYLAAFRDKLKQDEYYEDVRLTLKSIRASLGLEYAYVVIPTEECQYYIWDGGEEDEEGICQFGDLEDYYGDGYTIMRGAFLNPGERTILITDDTGSADHDYGYLASAYVAILGSDGKSAGEACIDVSMDQINANIHMFVLLITLVIVAVSIVFVLAYFFFIKHSVLKPIQDLNRATSELVSHNMDKLSAFNVKVKTNDELETLCDSFNTMAFELQTYITNLTTMTAEKERISAELDVATGIQSSMLPCIFPAFPDRNEFDIYATMTPAKEVGGDFYDFFMVDNTHLAIVAADVSGKGVPAALFMVIGKTLIKDHTSPDCNLDKVFAVVNNLLCESNSEGMFITAYECVIDLVTGEVTFVNAGHEMPFVYRQGGDFTADTVKHSFVLAGMENVRYKMGTFTINEGDKIFQYTDGVTEATDANNQLYGMERLTAVLNSVKDKRPDEILPAVKTDIDKFVGDAPQFDDITMVCFEFKKKMQPTTEQNGENEQ